MTVAHELALRGECEVTVYELRATAGGKARSIDGVSAAPPGLSHVPGEHGFRFVPGFYRHLPDTMARIPLAGSRDRVVDNLVEATDTLIAQDGDQPPLIAPNQAPGASWLDGIKQARSFARATELTISDQLHFLWVLLRLMSASPRRRFRSYEQQSWWDFSNAERRTRAYREFLADGLTRSLVAAKAREISARTGGYILLQLLAESSRPSAPADRVLNGPTSTVWIDPWLDELRRLGVRFELGHRVEELVSDRSGVTGVAGHQVSWEGGTPTQGAQFEDQADLFVAAVPVEVIRDQLDLGNLPSRSPELRNLGSLTSRWMNGIQFYLREDVPIVRGHAIYIDSPWALTSVSQRQFWPSVDFSHFGEGRIGGVLSVDVSDWDARGAHVAADKPARDCTQQEIAEEVWAQLKQALNHPVPVLEDENLVSWFVDPDIVAPNPGHATRESMNLEPLLINTKGSWDARPNASLSGGLRLYLAADYVRTYTDLATMEAANEAARRAVNAILDATGSAAPRCPVWPLVETGGRLFAVIRAIDALVFRLTPSSSATRSPIRARVARPAGASSSAR